MKRETLEKYQVYIYLVAIIVGLLLGAGFPEGTDALEVFLWPVLGILLFTTFTQVPLARLGEAFSNPRFMAAAVVGNFVVLPFIVWGLMALGPDQPAVRLGILLVLLVPCTDWFITFSHLGGGDTRHAIAFSPVSLLLQLLLLPFYLWMFLGTEVATSVIHRELVAAFLGLIVLPLCTAFVTEKWAKRQHPRQRVLEAFGWCPVPLLALVVFSIAAAQVSLVIGSLGLLWHLLVIFVAFLLIAGLLSRVLSRVFQLPSTQGRVLAFSLGSRNSFVVLPLALTLPPPFEIAVVAVVFQSLVELFGMAVYVWWVPKRLYP